MNTEHSQAAVIDAAAERARSARRSDLTGSERSALLSYTVDCGFRRLSLAHAMMEIEKISACLAFGPH
jgi:hypothetical protein